MLGGHAGGDTFVFAADFGKATIVNSSPSLGALQFDHNVATPAQELGHSEGAASDAPLLQIADLWQHHHNDFHIV
jgi:hypothetical protein